MQLLVRRSLYGLILIAGLAWIAVSADHSQASTGGLIPAPQQGFSAPNFTLQTTAGGPPVHLSDERGKPVLLNMWATWCPPCRAEMPTIQKLYQEYQSQGLVVLAVDSTIQDDATAIAPFVNQYNLTFPILLDSTGEVTYLYQLRSLPTSFFVGRDGVIKQVVVGGPMSEAQIRQDLQEILK